MSKRNIIRAWKDPEYRESLSEEIKAELPDNPAGPIELIDISMTFAGAAATEMCTKYPGCTLLCPPTYTPNLTYCLCTSPGTPC